MAKIKTIKVNATKEGFPQAREYVEKALRKRRVSASIASEMMRLFEALFHEIVLQVGDEGAELEIDNVSKLGHMDIKMTFAGKRFLLPEGDASSDPDAKVIGDYSDKLSCSYQNGDNVVRISVSKNAWSFILPNLIAVIAAIIVGLVLEFTLDAATQQQITKEWIAPLEKLFTNAMLMIGAPMTLFSLLKNVSDAFIVAERHSSSRKLFISSMASSVVVVALALVMGILFALFVLPAAGLTERFDVGFANWSLASAVDQIIPSSIIQPFETISPIPMIVVALLIAGALKSIGKSFNLLKPAIDSCYDLFSGILQIVMTAFPVACFLLFLEILLSRDGIDQLIRILFIVSCARCRCSSCTPCV